MAIASRSIHRRWQSRPMSIFLVFALGIVIPSGFLSYLGFRSYQYESALLHKEAEERYQSVAEVMQRKTREALEVPVRALRDLAGQEAFQDARLPEVARVLTSIGPIASAPVEYAALFNDQDRLLFPIKQDFHEPAAGSEPQWGPLEPQMRRLENLEFAHQDLPDALDGYRALLREPLTAAERAALWINIGNAASRLGKTALAESAYQTLIRENEMRRDPTGQPYGLVGRKLLVRLDDAQDSRREAAVSVRLDMWEGLMVGRWGDLSTRDAWLAEVEPSLRKALANAPRALRLRAARIEALKSRLEVLRAQTPVFLNRTWPSAAKRLRDRGWMDQGGMIRLGAFPSERWLVAAPVMARSGDLRRGLLVVVVDPTPWKSQIAATLTDIVRPAGLRFALSSESSGRLSGWRRATEKSADGVDPPLKLALYEPASSTQDRLSRRRLWIYGGMVGLSLLVIVIGLWMMGLAVRREVEIAQLKSDFVANVSHELRTPLSAIAYIAERLNRGRYRSQEEAKDFYGMLREEAARLQELIEDVLDFSKILGGKKIYHKEPVDLAQAAREAMDRLKGKADSAGFQFSFDAPAAPLLIEADRRAVVQALANLLDNAMKYSGQSRAVAVTVRSEGGQAFAEVADHGIGIPAAEQPRIFEKFYRVERGVAREPQSGVGLGLSLVRHIMQSHGGEVNVRSEVGRGSVFTLRFPRVEIRGKAA